MRDLARAIGALGIVALALGAGSTEWSRTIGEPSPELEVRIRSVAGHRSGRALVAGSFTGQLSLDRPLASSPGKRDLFVAQLDSAGIPRQSLLLGGDGPRELSSAAFDPGGNVILAGKFSGTLDFGGGQRLVMRDSEGSSGFVAKLDRSGRPVWLEQIEASTVTLLDIHGAAADAQGNVVLCGYVDGRHLSLGGAPLGVSSKFAIKLDPSGHVAWSTRLRYGIADTLPPVLDPSGNAIIAFVSESLEWIHLIKLDPSGSELWRKKLGGGITQELTGLAVDSAGNLLLAGRGGLGDAPPEGELGFVAKLDPEGRVVAVQRGTRRDYTSVAVDEHDNVITAGSTSPDASFGDGSERGAGPRFVTKLDPALRPVWTVRIAGDAGRALEAAAIPGGPALVAGTFTGPLDVGGSRLAGGAGKNAFVAALAP